MILYVFFFTTLIFLLLLVCRAERNGVGSAPIVFYSVVWCVTLIWFHWILGPYSHLGHYDEVSGGIPSYWLRTQNLTNTSFLMGFAGGTDITIGMAGHEILSLQRLLLVAFPLWLGLLIFRLGALLLIFYSAFRISRDIYGGNQKSSFVVGAFATTSHYMFFWWVWGGHGWELSLILFSIWLMFSKLNSSQFWIGATFLTLVAPTTSYFYLALPTAGTAWIAAIIAFGLPGKRVLSRHAALGVLITVAYAINFGQFLKNIGRISAHSVRALGLNRLPKPNEDMAGLPPRVDFWKEVDLLLSYLGRDMIYISLLVTLAVFLMRRNIGRVSLRLPIAIATPFVLCFTLEVFPWHQFGLPVQFSHYRWHVIYHASVIPIVLTFAKSLTELPTRTSFDPWPEGFGFGIFETSAYILTFLAITYNAGFISKGSLSRWRAEGGIATTFAYEGLGDFQGEGVSRLRTVTSTSRPVSATALYYGLDTFDGLSAAFVPRRSYFLALGVRLNPVYEIHRSRHYLNLPPLAESAKGRFPNNVDWNLLAVANVGYVLSFNKLLHKSLILRKQWEGKTVGDLLFPVKSFLPVLIAKFPVQQPLYFYSLDGTWPRAFVGQKLTISKYSYREPEFYNEISRNPWLALHVSAEDAEIVNNAWPVDYHLTSSDSPNVKSVSEASDGFTLELSNASGGTVAVNLPFTSLWSASCGGSPTTLVPVNGVQMAAFVPKGCTSLRFVYSP